MSVKMSARAVGDVTVVDVSGRITAGEGSNIFRQTIRDQVAQGNKDILLNLEEVSYIDSSGLGELVLGHGTVTQNICDSCGASVFQNDQGGMGSLPAVRRNRPDELGTLEADQPQQSGARVAGVLPVEHGF